MGGMTDFLFARPSFVEGMGRAIDLGGTLTEYNQSLDGAQADALALRMDWMTVGDDVRRAMAEFRAQYGPPAPNAQAER